MDSLTILESYGRQTTDNSAAIYQHIGNKRCYNVDHENIQSFWKEYITAILQQKRQCIAETSRDYVPICFIGKFKFDLQDDENGQHNYITEEPEFVTSIVSTLQNIIIRN